MSPAVTAADEDSDPVHRQLPAVELSHSDQCEYVSVADTLVHSSVAEVAMLPLEAAAQVATLRVLSEAALLVPFSPGSPVCNLT